MRGIIEILHFVIELNSEIYFDINYQNISWRYNYFVFIRILEMSSISLKVSQFFYSVN